MSDTKVHAINSKYPPADDYLEFFKHGMLSEEPSRSLYLELEQLHNGNMLLVYDICYLRTMSRWTRELEKELIELHKAGTPANVYTFGITENTEFENFEEVNE